MCRETDLLAWYSWRPDGLQIGFNELFDKIGVIFLKVISRKLFNIF